MNKKQMSEQDIRSKSITPAIIDGGWDIQSQIREEVSFTAGRVTQSEADIPFDLRHLRYVHYLNNGEGLRDLGIRLRPRLESLS